MINKVINIDPQMVRLLPTIVAVAESKNFKEAADKLQISQPAITQQMKALEDSFKIPLFKVVGKRKVLTPFGDEVYSTAKQHLNQLMTSVSMAQNKFSDPSKRIIRIGARSEILQFILPQLKFAGKFHCSLLSAHEAAQKLLEGELDLAISHERPESSELFSKVAFESHTVFAAHKNLLKKYKNRITPEFFEANPYLVYNRKDSYFFDLIATNFDLKKEIINPKIICEDWGVIKSMIINQMGYSIVPFYVASTFSDEIETISLSKKEPRSFTYYFLFRRENKAEMLELLKSYK